MVFANLLQVMSLRGFSLQCLCVLKFSTSLASGAAFKGCLDLHRHSVGQSLASVVSSFNLLAACAMFLQIEMCNLNTLVWTSRSSQARLLCLLHILAAVHLANA